MLLKGALHIHTTCSDGELSIPEVIEVYSGLGFDFIALTDHDFLLREGCYDRQLAGVETEMLLFRGIELSVFEKGYVHVNRIEGDSEVLHVFNHPSALYLPMGKLRERISEVALRYPVDVVEITDRGFYSPEYDIPEIPFPKIASDDAHTRDGCGRAWIEMDCERDRDAILRAIKSGNSWNCFNT